MTPQLATADFQAEPKRPLPTTNLEIALPEPGSSLTQDAEWCVVRVGREWRRIRFHDYAQLFSIPGLYEKVIYEILRCNSPEVVIDLLARAMKADGESPADLRVLDLGAGNGMVGELIAKRNADLVIGVDIVKEAAEATQRDRPDAYNDYHVVDMTNLGEKKTKVLKSYEFNCMTCVAALGFGDIPTEVFTNAFNLVQTDGWIAFNVKEDFLDRQDVSGFSALIREMTVDGALNVRVRQRYQHRLATDREPIHYVAIVGRKQRDIE